MTGSLTTLCTTFTVTCHVGDKGLGDSSALPLRPLILAIGRAFSHDHARQEAKPSTDAELFALGRRCLGGHSLLLLPSARRQLALW